MTVSLNDAADATDVLSNEPGYAGVSVDEATSTITVHWKGKAPESLLRMQREAPAGITLDVVPARFSSSQLSAASQGLLVAAMRRGLPVTSTGPSREFDGLSITASPELTSAERSELLGELRGMTGLPLTSIEPMAPPVPRSRQNDSAPWQGAGVMKVDATGELCTVGFTVLTPGGQGRLLSAGHCAPNGNSPLSDGAGQSLSVGGDAVDVRQTNDTLLIDPVDGTTGKVFGGPWDAGTGHARYQFPVVAKGLPKIGTSVCLSGAMTGEHCNAVIHDTGRDFTCGPLNATWTCHGFMIRSTNGNIIDGAGDSGAPVYFDRGDGTVGARGIFISGVGGYATGCPSDTAHPLAYGQCDTRAWAVGYQTLEDQWNVIIEFW